MHSKGHFTIVRLEVGARSRSRSRCAGAIGSNWMGTVCIYRLQQQGVHGARVGPSCVFFCLISKWDYWSLEALFTGILSIGELDASMNSQWHLIAVLTMIFSSHSTAIYSKPTHTLYDVLSGKTKWSYQLYLWFELILFFSFFFSKLEHLIFKVFFGTNNEIVLLDWAF